MWMAFKLLRKEDSVFRSQISLSLSHPIHRNVHEMNVMNEFNLALFHKTLCNLSINILKTVLLRSL